MAIDEKRLPIVVLLDASGSMLFEARDKNETKLDAANRFICEFIELCAGHYKAGKRADICFVQFTDEVILSTDFHDINDLGNHIMRKRPPHSSCGKIAWKKMDVSVKDQNGAVIGTKRINFPHFAISEYDNGTNIGKAVLHGIERINERIEESSGYPPYFPFLILVSDGHNPAPNQCASGDDLTSQREAISKLRDRASTGKNECNLIIPLVVPVGDTSNIARLRQYLGDFESGEIPCEMHHTHIMNFIARLMEYSITQSTSRTSLQDLPGPEPFNYDD